MRRTMAAIVSLVLVAGIGLGIRAQAAPGNAAAAARAVERAWFDDEA